MSPDSTRLEPGAEVRVSPISAELTLHLRRVSRSLNALGILRAANELSQIAGELDQLREQQLRAAVRVQRRRLSGGSTIEPPTSGSVRGGAVIADAVAPFEGGRGSPRGG